ncbi:MAG TPA: DUF2079 domain-containing protein, partial [Candidatus Baltobacteraceae bacterium]|nr:DUF2079 domain-containing protein [Candidatus Baltobacteraceae bacterium]
VAAARTPLVLQFVQIVLIVASALLLERLVRPYVSAAWSQRIGVLVLLYPPLLAGAFSEFHELAFYPPLLLALLLAADRAQWLWFALCAIVLVCVREDASVDIVAIGIALAVAGLAKRTTRERGLLLWEPREPERLFVAGVGLAVAGAASLAVYGALILPRTGPWAPSHFYDYPFAHGPVQTALAIFTHPVALLAAVVTLGRLTYVLEALLPLALLPLFSRWSLFALPAFAGILLASDASVWRMGMHYVLLWAPLLLLGAAVKLVHLVRNRDDVAANRWWLTAVVLSVIVLAAFDPMHPAHYLKRESFMHASDAQRALACVPRNAPVAMHDEWYAHEALAYPNATVLGAAPQAFSGYVAYDSAWKNPLFEKTLPALTSALRDGRFVPACASGTVRVLRATSFRTTE